MGHFFLSSHLSTLVTLFFAVSSDFSFQIHCLQMLQLFQTRDGPFFFIITLVYICCAFFLLYHQKIFIPYIVLVTVRLRLFRNETLFFFSFKIHCLQMLQLFQTRDGPFFFHRHTCLHLSRFFLLYHQISPFKYIVYKCYSCFRPGMGLFFSSSHLSIFVALFLLYHQKIFIPYIVLVTVRLRLFRNETLFFFSFKIHCLQMLQLFQTKDGPIFFIVTLVYTCHTYFAVSSENICPIYCLGHSTSQSVLQ